MDGDAVPPVGRLPWFQDIQGILLFKLSQLMSDGFFPPGCPLEVLDVSLIQMHSPGDEPIFVDLIDGTILFDMEHQILLIPDFISVLTVIEDHLIFRLNANRRGRCYILTHNVLEVHVVFYVLALFELLAELELDLVREDRVQQS
jgi:hypothetical protein